MKIGIVVPTHDIVPAMFAYDLAQLVAYTVAAMPEDTEVGVAFLPGTYIHKARQELMQHVLEKKYDYVLWLDSDMRFPKETFAHLLRHKVAMVGANYVKRAIPTWPVALESTGLDGQTPERLYPSEDKTGLTEVEAVGFGVLLMRMADFQNMPPLSEGEWFAQEYIRETGQWVGEDVSFCRLVRKKLGIKVMVDQDLSWTIGHIGQMEYKQDHLLMQEELDGGSSTSNDV